ncbi:MAG TPA: integrase core domain-containing protein [Acidimicrobiales bacterium]|nr:integrase core domain-containing protein [Acidimicrobiales bacterium]
MAGEGLAPRRGGELAAGGAPEPGSGLDFQFDESADHRRLKSSKIVDEHTREALTMKVEPILRTPTPSSRSTSASLPSGGAAEHLRMDNGPELVASALRYWCRLAGTTTIYVEPGSPWENPFIESFNGRVRDELLNTEEFTSLLQAQIPA